MKTVKIVVYTLMTGLLLCSAGVMADDGNSVPARSNGSLAISGLVDDGTCRISVSGTEQVFSVPHDVVNSHVAGDILGERRATFMLSGCAGKNVFVDINPKKFQPNGAFGGVGVFDDVSPVAYRLAVSAQNDSTINGGSAWKGYKHVISDSPIVFGGVGHWVFDFIPDSNLYPLVVSTVLIKISDSIPGNTTSRVSTGYVYNFTYS
ncbi:hypothetical protein EW445_17885 [Salmonella enterica subsp. enterica serovar Newport]|uniref:Type 1 fimbrial protein n=1 Tax=Salmonella enterica subsp. salamae TaxID=59202 RepID=A0A5Y3MZ83_SALER|nr:hypothetical protein [Salmonella enterica subsp. enterica serovar Newport]ECI4011696.1 hypothetical protein [Salmonella enterica subsp. salamae]